MTLNALMKPFNDPTIDELYIKKSIRCLAPIQENLTNKIKLPFSTIRVRDYLIPLIDPETLIAILDADKYFDDAGIPKGNRSQRYIDLEEDLNRLDSMKTWALIPDPNNTDIEISVRIAWATRIVRIDKKKTKTGRIYAVQFDPLIAPNIIDLQENFLQYPQKFVFALSDSEISYMIYQFFLPMEGCTNKPVQIQTLLDFIGKKESDFTKRTTMFDVCIKTPIKKVNERMDIYIDFEFGKRPVSEMFVSVRRKYGKCGFIKNLAHTQIVEAQEDSEEVKAIKAQIQYDDIADMISSNQITCYESHLDLVVSCMDEVLNNPQEAYSINKNKKFPAAKLQEAYRRIEKTEVIYALTTIYAQNLNVSFPIAYYRTTLYNATIQAKAALETKTKAANSDLQSDQPKRRELDIDEIMSVHQMMGSAPTQEQIDIYREKSGINDWVPNWEITED